MRFETAWLDPASGITRNFILTVYPGEVEMFDVKTRKLFLKRTSCTLPTDSLSAGRAVNVLGRQLRIAAYADESTGNFFANHRTSTFALIKPEGYKNLGSIIQAAIQAGLEISRLRMGKLSRETAQMLFHDDLIDSISSDVVLGLELSAPEAVSKWRELLGSIDFDSQTIRGRFGRDVAYGSESKEDAEKELNLFFESIQKSAVFDNCSCLLIRPHAMKSAGLILQRVIDSGFEISALQMFNVGRDIADEFLEVYKGILPEQPEQVSEMSSGSFIVAEIRQEGVVDKLRKLAGPHDPEIAKVLRPNTLRAEFGIDRVKNAVHVSDLEEDGVLECQYWFNIINSQ